MPKGASNKSSKSRSASTSPPADLPATDKKGLKRKLDEASSDTSKPTSTKRKKKTHRPSSQTIKSPSVNISDDEVVPTSNPGSELLDATPHTAPQGSPSPTTTPDTKQSSKKVSFEAPPSSPIQDDIDANPFLVSDEPSTPKKSKKKAKGSKSNTEPQGPDVALPPKKELAAGDRTGPLQVNVNKLHSATACHKAIRAALKRLERPESCLDGSGLPWPSQVNVACVDMEVLQEGYELDDDFIKRLTLFLNTNGWRSNKIVNPLLVSFTRGTLGGKTGTSIYMDVEYPAWFGLVGIVSSSSLLSGNGSIKIGPLSYMWYSLATFIHTRFPSLGISFYSSKGDLILFKSGDYCISQIVDDFMLICCNIADYSKSSESPSKSTTPKRKRLPLPRSTIENTQTGASFMFDLKSYNNLDIDSSNLRARNRKGPILQLSA
ncbi:hypothetical protein CPB86DRAFT_820078 [Serendipita vermifera]|nr:hypothetical protein CPB86DRAFT_820078 [Serendipita vermifera]